MKELDEVREQVLALLRGGGAHASFDDIIEALPESCYGKRPAELPYSPWELVEHMRLAQWDILEYSRDKGHQSPPWPDGYWPDSPAPASAKDWHASVDRFRADLHEMETLVQSAGAELVKPFDQNPEHNLLRQALLVADHNAYHLGQLIVVRRLLGAWQ